MKNTESRKTVKTVFGLILVILLVSASICGFELPFGIEDVIPQDTIPQATVPPATQETQNMQSQLGNMEAPVEDTSSVSQPSATDVTANQNVDNSGVSNVANPSEEQITNATEGEITNA